MHISIRYYVISSDSTSAAEATIWDARRSARSTTADDCPRTCDGSLASEYSIVLSSTALEYQNVIPK